MFSIFWYILINFFTKSRLHLRFRDFRDYIYPELLLEADFLIFVHFYPKYIFFSRAKLKSVLEMSIIFDLFWGQKTRFLDFFKVVLELFKNLLSILFELIRPIFG